MIKEKLMLKGSFKKNVLMITAGTSFAQLMNFIMTPIITRLYTPEEYGVISVYIAILVSFSFFGSLNFEMGIPIAEDDEKAINVLALSVLTLITITLISLVLFCFFGDLLLNILKGEVLLKYKYFIPLGVFLLGLYNIFNQWALRNKDFKSITKTKFSQSIAQNSVSILGGIAGAGPIGLIIGRVFGQSAGLTTLSYSLLKKKTYFFQMIQKEKIINSAKRFKNFPLYTTPRRFLGDITISLPTLFITSLYGSTVVGLFGLANSVIQLPMNLIGNSIGNVFYAECAALRGSDPKRIKNLSDKLLKTLILIGVLPLIALLFFGPTLFKLVFGNEWYDAGVFASLLSVSVFFKLIFTPISSIFDIYERQELALGLNIIRVILVIVVFGLSSVITLNVYWTVGLYSAVMSIVYVIQYYLAQRIINDIAK